MRSRVLFPAIAAVAVALSAVAVATPVEAASYPGNKCVSAKLKAASSHCKAVLGAWSKYVNGGGVDTDTRDAALTKTSGKIQSAYTKANDNAAKKAVDCGDMTSTVTEVENVVTADVAAIVADVTAGLTLSNKDDAKCGAALLKAASSQCSSLFKAWASYVGKLSGGSAKRDAAVTKADSKLSSSVANALVGCPSGATLSSIDTAVDGLTDEVITNHIISPNVSDDEFDTITPSFSPGVEYEGRTLHPICSFSTPYHFFVKRGTVNKLVMYYQGGGACWNTLTCGVVGTFDKDVDPGSSDNPNNVSTGFADLTNPDNPFKDWHIVFVSYCTGDIHFGDAENHFYSGFGGYNVQHVGYQNSRVVEKFAREHFVAPEAVFVTGSSAGAYGAFFNAPLHHFVWPDSQFSVLGDAGNGIITEDFLEFRFPVWNFEANLPSNIPGIREAIEDKTGIPAYTKAVADFFPSTMWAHYTTSYDGGTGGQTGFYNVMQHDTDNPAEALAEWPTWWEASCDWNDVMRQQAIDTAAATATTDNYRYYIGTGSRHTMYGSDKVYTDISGGVPTIVDWINDMLARDPGWSNEECSVDCGVLLPGDPRENGDPPPAPFVDDNADDVADRIFCP